MWSVTRILGGAVSFERSIFTFDAFLYLETCHARMRLRNDEPNVISSSIEVDRGQRMQERGKANDPVIDSGMRDGNRQGIGDSAEREVTLEVQDKGFDNDVNGESEEFERMDRERHGLR